MFNFRRSEIRAGWLWAVPVFLYKVLEIPLFPLFLWLCWLSPFIIPIGAAIAGWHSQRWHPVTDTGKPFQQGAIAGLLVGIGALVARVLHALGWGLWASADVASGAYDAQAAFGGALLAGGIPFVITLIAVVVGMGVGGIVASTAYRGMGRPPSGQPPTYQSPRPPSSSPPSPSDTQPNPRPQASGQPQQFRQSRPAVDWISGIGAVLNGVKKKFAGVDKETRDFALNVALWIFIAVGLLNLMLPSLRLWMTAASEWGKRSGTTTFDYRGSTYSVFWVSPLRREETAEVNFSGNELNLALSGRENGQALVAYGMDQQVGVMCLLVPVPDQ